MTQNDNQATTTQAAVPHVQRIVSLLASGTEILYGLGLGDCVVAVSHECDYPTEVNAKPRVTSSRVPIDISSGEIDAAVGRLVASGEPLYEIDIAEIASLAPELIVTQAHCEVCAVSYDDVVAAVASEPVLSNTRIVALTPNTLDAVFDDVKRVAVASGCLDGGEAYVRDLTQRVERVRAATSVLTVAQQPRVLCIEWIEPLIVAANWMPELIDFAGGQCDLVRSGASSAVADWEEVIEFDPEVIVVMPCGFDLERTKREAGVLRRRSGWDGLSACRNGRVYAVDGNAYFNRSGPRLVDSLEILAKLIHPSLFADNAWGEGHEGPPVSAVLSTLD